MVNCDPSELLNEAQFHGSKRLLGKKWRWIWFILFMILIGCSLSMVTELLKRYFQNPTYLSQSVAKVPLFFPTVMVCPEIDYHETNINAFLDEILIPGNVNKTRIRENMGQLAAFYSPDVNFELEDLQELETVLDYNNMDVEDAGKRLTNNCSETIIRCRWQGEISDCVNIFRMELISYGFCCIFNGRSLRRIYNPKVNQTIPPRVKQTSKTPGAQLSFVVKQYDKLDNVDLDYKWVVVQDSSLYLDTPRNGTPMSPGVAYWVGYNSQRQRISQEARQLSNDILRCKLAEEPMKYFPSYSRYNCLLECEMKTTLEKCGCLGWTHPHLPGTSYCRADQLLCVRHSFVPFAHNCNNCCGCIQSCTSDSDIVETSSFNLIPRSQTIDPLFANISLMNVSVVRVYFLPGQNLITRLPYHDTLNLFAQVGGIFSVFFGCSILTLLELLQLLINFINYRIKKYKQLRTEQKKVFNEKAGKKIHKNNITFK